MRDIDDLRRALDTETAGLAVHLPPDVVRSRARRVRRRRAAVAAAAAFSAVAALAVPTILLTGGTAGYDPAGGGSTACPAPSSKAGQAAPVLSPPVETGVTLDARDTRYDVLLGLIGIREQPGFVIAFRDRLTGTVEMWDVSVLVRDANGDFPGKRVGDPGHQFLSGQLALGPDSVLDVGLYTRAAHRITVASEGRAADAETAWNAATGWTFFWAKRAAAPLPPGHDATPVEYEGPERLTITAYDAAGRLQHAVTGGFAIGHNVQNPRDNEGSGISFPNSAGTPTTGAPGCPPASTPN